MTQVLEHKHLIVRAELDNPPMDVAEVDLWIKALVEKIGMKILMGPYAVYSEMENNRGLTMVAIIETSHIVLHTWDECTPGLMQLDVYTCSELNINDVFYAVQEFGPSKIEYTYIDRENGLTLLDQGRAAIAL